MSRYYETSPDQTPLPRRGFLSSNPYASSSTLQSHRNTLQTLSRDNSNTRYDAEKSDPNPNRRDSRTNFSPARGIVTWGITSPDDVYQTSYKNHFETPDKSNSAARAPERYVPNTSLSASLIPYNVNETRRVSKSGECNHLNSRRVSTENDSFLDKIGERKQPSPDRGRVHLKEPRVEDPGLKGHHRFYRPIEETHGESARKLSASRLVKQIMDFCPPQSFVSGGGVATKSIDSLSFTKDIDTVHANKLGSDYKNVEKKLVQERARGKKQGSRSMSENEIKGLIAHSHLARRESSIEQQQQLKVEEPRHLRVSFNHKHEEPTYKAIRSKRNNRGNQQDTQRSQSNIRLETDPMRRRISLGTFESARGRDREANVKKEGAITFDPRKWNMKEHHEWKAVVHSPGMNGFMKSLSKPAGRSNSRERSTSGSPKSMRGSFSRKSSSGILDLKPREISKDKNSCLIVSHEKKKPTTVGTFKTPMLMNNKVQKFVSLRANTGMFADFKKNILKS